MPEDDKRTFSVSLACDSDMAMRQQCPSCGMDFKLVTNGDAQSDALSWWVRETMREAGVSAEEPEIISETSYTCPYCGTSRTAQLFAHPDSVNFAKRFAIREIVEPMFGELFAGLASASRSNKFVKVTVTSNATRSARPISGPEPDDCLPICCLQCSARFKVVENWDETVFCPLCSTELSVL